MRLFRLHFEDSMRYAKEQKRRGVAISTDPREDAIGIRQLTGRRVAIATSGINDIAVFLLKQDCAACRKFDEANEA